LNAANVSNVRYVVNSTTNYEYYIAMPLENMAQLDKSFWAESISKLGREKFLGILSAIDKNVIESRLDVYTHRIDLSYNHPSLKNTEMGFRKWLMYEFKPGTDLQRTALRKEWLALFEKHDIVRSAALFEGLIGPNEGTIVVLREAKDEETYIKENKEFWKKTGAEGRALWEKTEALLVKSDTRSGSLRLDLSRLPSSDTQVSK